MQLPGGDRNRNKVTIVDPEINWQKIRLRPKSQRVNQLNLPSRYAGADVQERTPVFPQPDELMEPPQRPPNKMYKPDRQLPMLLLPNPRNQSKKRRCSDDEEATNLATRTSSGQQPTPVTLPILPQYQPTHVHLPPLPQDNPTNYHGKKRQLEVDSNTDNVNNQITKHFRESTIQGTKRDAVGNAHRTRSHHATRWERKHTNNDDIAPNAPTKKPNFDIPNANLPVKRCNSPTTVEFEPPLKKFDNLNENRHSMLTRAKNCYQNLQLQVDLLDFVTRYFN